MKTHTLLALICLSLLAPSLLCQTNSSAAKAGAATEKQATLRIGSNYGGGIIFYIDRTGQHGLIAATADQGTENWYNAVTLCKNYRSGGYTDWFMPSKDQLHMLYLQKSVIGGFADDCYWSATECDLPTENGIIHNVRIQCSDGSDGCKSKSNTMRLRAIRAF